MKNIICVFTFKNKQTRETGIDFIVINNSATMPSDLSKLFKKINGVAKSIMHLKAFTDFSVWTFLFCDSSKVTFQINEIKKDIQQYKDLCDDYGLSYFPFYF